MISLADAENVELFPSLNDPNVQRLCKEINKTIVSTACGNERNSI